MNINTDYNWINRKWWSKNKQQSGCRLYLGPFNKFKLKNQKVKEENEF